MQFVPAELIQKKRNGGALSDQEIAFFINGYTAGTLPDYQMSAMLMAIYFQGMSDAETLALTKTMLFSGKTIDLSRIHKFKVDKHSTGGVGDKTSLILGPVVAACGLAVPMISGRGLGHTGGTVDKMESIPGLQMQLTLDRFVELMQEHGICYISQSKEICPADRKIYGLRDVTATVESIPLICASILSKKLAEGIDGLVLDVKFGSGSFMQTAEKAEALAKELMKIAKGYGKKVCTLITNMDQPLGRYAGNSLEVVECLEILQNKWPQDPVKKKMYEETAELSLALSAQMIFMGGQAESLAEARVKANDALVSGRALAVFEKLIQVQGGDLTKIPLPQNSKKILAQKSGYVVSMQTSQIGYAGVLLKAGRAQSDDVIEPTAGIEFHVKVGDSVKIGDPLFTLHGADPKLFPAAEEKLVSSLSISDSVKVSPLILILKELT